MSDYPDDMEFSSKHVWVKKIDGSSQAYVGITDFLAEELARIDCIEVPSVTDEIEVDSYCLHLHVRNTVRHLRSPLTGKVVEINQEVLDNPSLVHLAPHSYWMYKIEYYDADEFSLLMNGTQYSQFLDQL